MPQFSPTSAQRLLTCDPRLQEVLQEAIKYVDFTVLCGHRNQADQTEAFMRGNSKLPWPKSKHNSFPSQAVDVAPWLPDVKIDWNDRLAFARLFGAIELIAKQKGVKLRWGGDFNKNGRSADESFLDLPHIELIPDSEE